MRMPTNSEIFLGVGLAMLFSMVVVPFIPENAVKNETLFLFLLVDLSVSILIVMKLKDAQHQRNAFEACQITFEGEFAKVLCPSAPRCTGSLLVFPPKEESIVFQCPVCRRRIAVHRDSKGEVLAYGARESEPIR